MYVCASVCDAAVRWSAASDQNSLMKSALDLSCLLRNVNINSLGHRPTYTIFPSVAGPDLVLFL